MHKYKAYLLAGGSITGIAPVSTSILDILGRPVLQFGPAGATIVEGLSVDWPSGQHETLRNVDANRQLVVTE